LTRTFAGIRPIDAPGFIAAQLAGGALALLLARWLLASHQPGAAPSREPVQSSERRYPTPPM